MPSMVLEARKHIRASTAGGASKKPRQEEPGQVRQDRKLLHSYPEIHVYFGAESVLIPKGIHLATVMSHRILLHPTQL